MDSQATRRELNADDDREALRATLEALGPGEALVLVGEDPRELVDELEEEESGRFEWSVLTDGGLTDGGLADGEGRTRLEVRRRSELGPRTVTGFLQADHQRLDAILPDVERLADAGSFAQARQRFGELAAGLAWHIGAEEEVLFPFFEAKTGMTNGPTVVMRGEHKELRDYMKRVVAALDAGDLAAARSAIGEFVTLLSTHNSKEESMLYPMTDRAMDSVEAQERLVRRIAKY